MPATAETPAHTPGPWRRAQINATDKPWAVIGQGPHGDEIVAGYLRTEADAAVIAAALDLLALLKELWRDPNIVSQSQRPTEDWLMRAHTAIAKAEGRAS